MNRDKFLKEIEKFKQADDVNKIIIVADDIPAVKILLFISNIDFDFIADNDITDTDWDSLWKCVKYDKTKLYKISSYNSTTVDRYINILTGNKIIYPDGSISENIKKYIQSIVVHKLQKNRKK